MTHREDRKRQLSAEAARSYAKHEIVSETNGRWLIKERYEDGKGWKGGFWAEIIVLRGGGLLVTGDMESVIFRYGPEHPRAAVAWMARRKTADDRYFLEKATIGSGPDSVQKWDLDVARDDIRELEKDEDYEEFRERLVEIREDELESRDLLLAGLYELDFESEVISDIGMVVDTHLYFAHAALQRLDRLLGSQDAMSNSDSRRYVLVDLRSVAGNCALFWAKGRSGYTCELAEAHIFDEAEAFSQHQCRPDIDWPLPVDVAQSLAVQHVRRGAVFRWAQENQDPRRTDPYGAQPRETRDA
jgi:hypothetical protein